MPQLLDVHKTYRMGAVEVLALRGVTLDIPDRQLTVVMGRSGSGKSTMLHLIGCLDTPTKGVVEHRGVNLGRLTSRERAAFRAKEAGFVFQKFSLMPNLSARENVELPLLLRNSTRSEARAASESALARVGLDDRMRHRPSKLSGGEQQRVAIARALINDPSLVLADEPTGNLDTATGASILALLRGLTDHEKTVILVTHDQGISELADLLVELQDGAVSKREAPVRRVT